MLLYLALGIFLALLAALFVVAYKWLRAVPRHRALVMAGPLGRSVVKGGGHGLVLPSVGRGDELELGPIVLEIERRGWAGLVFADQEHVDVKARLTLQLEPEPESLLRTARLLGGSGASDPRALEPIIGPSLSEALKVTAARMGAECLRRRDRFCKRTLKALAVDLNGYTLEALEVEFPGLPEAKRREGPFR